MKVLIGAFSEKWANEVAASLKELGLECTVVLSAEKIESFMTDMQNRIPVEEKGLILTESIGSTSTYDLLLRLEKKRKDQTMQFPFGSLVLATELVHDQEIIDILKRRGVVALSSAQNIEHLAKVTNDSVMAAVRSSIRVSIVWEATITVDGEKVSGHIHDLSTGGVLFRPKKYKDTVALQKKQKGLIDIDTDFEDNIQCEFEIQWRKEYKKFLSQGVGFGLQFVDVDAQTVEQISEYVESIQSQQLAVTNASSMFYF